MKFPLRHKRITVTDNEQDYFSYSNFVLLKILSTYNYFTEYQCGYTRNIDCLFNFDDTNAST